MNLHLRAEKRETKSRRRAPLHHRPQAKVRKMLLGLNDAEQAQSHEYNAQDKCPNRPAGHSDNVFTAVWVKENGTARLVTVYRYVCRQTH